MGETKGHYAKLNKPSTRSNSYVEYKALDLIQEGMDQKLRKQRDGGEVISGVGSLVLLHSRLTTETDDALCFKKLERFGAHLPCETSVFLMILMSISIFNHVYQGTL